MLRSLFGTLIILAVLFWGWHTLVSVQCGDNAPPKIVSQLSEHLPQNIQDKFHTERPAFCKMSDTVDQTGYNLLEKVKDGLGWLQRNVFPK